MQMYACVDIVYMPWHIWGSQRTMFGSQFSPSTRRVSEMNSSHQSKKQVLSSTEPSCQPHLHLFFYFTLKENPVHSNNRQMLTSGWTVGRLEKQGCKNTKGCFLHSGDNFVDAEEGQNSSDYMPETCTNYYRAIVSLKSCQTTGKG